MEINEIRAELESELTWRTEEMRFLKNRLADISGHNKKMLYRKSLIVMLYAHYEGFFKFSLLLYIRSVNDEKIKCSEAVPALVASSWNEIFSAVMYGDKKEKVFKKKLPDDDFLHSFARKCDFIDKLPDFRSDEVEIPESAINTESNLWAHVLKKNLYYVGLNHDVFSKNDGTINQLVNRRNNVAHGSEIDGIKAENYNKFERTVLKMMEDFLMVIVTELRNESFKKRSQATGSA